MSLYYSHKGMTDCKCERETERQRHTKTDREGLEGFGHSYIDP